MKQPTNFRQCVLRKPHRTGHLEQVAWIPDVYAHIGRTIRLRSKDGNWDDGWVVVTASATRPAHEVLDHERDYTKMPTYVLDGDQF